MWKNNKSGEKKRRDGCCEDSFVLFDTLGLSCDWRFMALVCTICLLYGIMSAVAAIWRLGKDRIIQRANSAMGWPDWCSRG
jgi:hypothetical protein